MRLSASPAILHGCASFLRPFFVVDESAKPAATVSVEPGHAYARRRPSGVTREVYTASDPAHSVSASELDGSGDVLELARGGHHLGDVWLNRGARTIQIQARSDSDAKFLVLRTIRDLVYFSLQREGMTVFHASAVAVGGEVVAICAQSGQGKTSTMISLVQQGAGYVTNDRLFASDNAQTAHGWPTFISLKPGPRYPMSIRSLFSSTPRDAEVSLELQEFCALLGANVVPTGPVACFVVVERDPGLGDRRVITQSGPEEVQPHCYTPDDPGCSDWLRWGPPIEREPLSSANFAPLVLEARWDREPLNLRDLDPLLG